MLNLVSAVCSHVAGIGHIVQLISLFVVDLYRVSLAQAVACDASLVLDHLLSTRFGRRHDECQVYDALTMAAERNRIRVILQLFEYVALHSMEQRMACAPTRFEPVEAAASHGQDQVLLWFWKHHRHLCGPKAMECAAANGQFATVRLLWGFKAVDCVECVEQRALGCGAFQIVAWLREQDKPSGYYHQHERCARKHLLDDKTRINSSIKSPKTREVLSGMLSSRSGLDALKWLLASFPKFESCQEMLVLAAQFGDLALVTWLYGRRETKWLKKTLQRAIHACASKGRDVQVVQFFLERGYSCSDNFYKFRVDLVHRLRDYCATRIATTPRSNPNPTARDAPDVVVACARMVHLLDAYLTSWRIVGDAIEFGDDALFKNVARDVGKHGAKSFQWFLGRAICRGRLEMLRFLLDQRMRWDVSRCMKSLEEAARQGYFQVITLILSRVECGLPNFMHVIRAAVEHDNLELIQLLHAKQAKGFSNDLCDLAMANGNVHMLRFLHENGCSWWSSMDEVAASGYLAVVQFLHTIKYFRCTKEAMNGAAANGFLHVVQFLRQNRTEGSIQEAMARAAQNGHVQVVKFLFEDATEDSWSLLLQVAARNGHVQVVQLLTSYLIARNQEVENLSALTNAFYEACRHNQFSVVHWLLTHQEVAIDYDHARAIASVGTAYPRNKCTKILQLLDQHAPTRPAKRRRLQ